VSGPCAAITPDVIKSRLEALGVDQIDVYDDSAEHRGHVGAGGGGHFSVLVISARFRDMNLVRRHQLIYDCLGDLMPHAIHALSIRALAPEEI